MCQKQHLLRKISATEGLSFPTVPGYFLNKDIALLTGLKASIDEHGPEQQGTACRPVASPATRSPKAGGLHSILLLQHNVLW